MPPPRKANVVARPKRDLLRKFKDMQRKVPRLTSPQPPEVGAAIAAVQAAATAVTAAQSAVLSRQTDLRGMHSAQLREKLLREKLLSSDIGQHARSGTAEARDVLPGATPKMMPRPAARHRRKSPRPRRSGAIARAAKHFPRHRGSEATAMPGLKKPCHSDAGPEEAVQVLKRFKALQSMPPAPVHATGAAPVHAILRFAKRPNEKLGIRVDNDGQILNVSGGLVSEWNESSGRQPVRAKDRIIEVNGRPFLKDVLGVLSADGDLTIVIERFCMDRKQA